MRRHLKSFCRFVFLIGITAGWTTQASASTWNTAASGDFDVAGNWTGGVPDGSMAIADFSTLDINGDISVTLDTAKTLGQLLFGDTGLGTAGSWELRTNITTPIPVITLDNGASKPVIHVGTLTPTTFDDAFIGHSLAGTNGFNKTGAGIATLGPGTAHTITGGINVNEGTLRLNAAVPAQAVSIGDGATLQTSVSLDGAANSLNVASGTTANLRIAGGVSIRNVAANDATMNVHFQGAAPGPTLTFNGDWAVGGDAAAYNFTSESGGFLRLRPNGGGFNTTTAFANAAVTLDNVNMWLRSNSQGNTINIGSLQGTSTATLNGGAQGGGTAARYSIGALNTDTEFAGTLDGVTDFGVGNISSLDVIKVGTGTLTFSGNLTNFVPSANASGATNPWRRGGNTQIQGGTIRLVGTTAIPGGVAGTAAGDLQSHIEVGAAGTLDVSGYTAGTYTTPALQSIVGSGNIIGNWNHAAGVIEAGNTLRALGSTDVNTNTNNVAGTLTFNGNLTLSGGDIGYSLSLDPNSGNDLIQVTGSANITAGGTIRVQPLAGVPSSGTYTVLTANGGLTGNGGLFTVDLPGRGSDPTAFVDGNSLKFNAVPGGGSASLVWTGANGGIWDVETTQAWDNNGSPDVFFDLDTVAFDDTATNKTVTITGAVSPVGVTVNTAQTYTFAGTGQIVGNTGFTKTGSGGLVFQQGNLFSGPASVTGGTLDTSANGNALGTGALSLDNVDVTAAFIGNSSLSVANGIDFTVVGNAGSGSSFTIPNLTGSGDITLTTAVVDKWAEVRANQGYTGTINFGTAGQAGTFSNLRMTTTGGIGDWSQNVFNFTGPTVLTNRQGGDVNVIQTIRIGEIHAPDTASGMTSFLGGSTAVPTNWEIGALNTNSDFAGVMADGGGSGGSTSQMHLTKVGTGTLTLTGTNTYTGNTTVNGGVLSINNPYLADTADVLIGAFGVFDLNFSATDVIDSLYLGGTPQNPGTYGAPGSGAANTSAFFTGAGILSVTTLGAPITQPGDFDVDGDVDGRDFLAWQRGNSPNGVPGVSVSAADLATWQANYGVGPLGAVSSLSAVPEPSCLLLIACGFAALTLRRRG